jgi:hypothetical protein
VPKTAAKKTSKSAPKKAPTPKKTPPGRETPVSPELYPAPAPSRDAT